MQNLQLALQYSNAICFPCRDLLLMNCLEFEKDHHGSNSRNTFCFVLFLKAIHSLATDSQLIFSLLLITPSSDKKKMALFHEIWENMDPPFHHVPNTKFAKIQVVDNPAFQVEHMCLCMFWSCLDVLHTTV